jgi:hypothetical protein
LIWQSGSVQLAPLFDSKTRFPPPGRKNFPITLFLVCSSLRMIWRRLRHNTISSRTCQGNYENFFRLYLLVIQAFMDGSKKRSRSLLQLAGKRRERTEHDSCLGGFRRRSDIIPNSIVFPKKTRDFAARGPKGLPRPGPAPAPAAEERATVAESRRDFRESSPAVSPGPGPKPAGLG